MYGENNVSVNAEKKQPYHMELAEKLFSELYSLPEKEQVEAFKYIQKRLADRRIEHHECMCKDLSNFNQAIKSHLDGTNIITAAL
jgi:hypothetical protein